MKPVFVGFETRLKFIKFGHRYTVFSCINQPWYNLYIFFCMYPKDTTRSRTRILQSVSTQIRPYMNSLGIYLSRYKSNWLSAIILKSASTWIRPICIPYYVLCRYNSILNSSIPLVCIYLRRYYSSWHSALYMETKDFVQLMYILGFMVQVM